MAKRKRKSRKKPMRYPLSRLDKFLYSIILVIGCIMSAAVVVIMAVIRDKVAFADASVVAVDGSDAVLLILPLCFFFLIISLFPLIYLDSYKELPIFGNKSFKPRPGLPYEEETPIVSRKFWQEMSDKTRDKIAKFLVAVSVILVICLALSLFGIYPRTVLDEENNIKTYNSFNEITDICNVEKADKLIIDIGVSSSRSNKSYYIELVFVFGEKKYDFGQGSFREMKREDVLEYMLRTKADFSGKYEVNGIDFMERLFKNKNFTAEEKALVYELFDYNG
jgi:hypothetical protein